MNADIKLYPIKRLNTEFEEIFDSLIAVYKNWHDSFVDSEIDHNVYYWYSEDEFNKLKIGQMMDDDTIYLTDINHNGYKIYQLEIQEEETR